MIKYYAGVDPGMSGAIAVVERKVESNIHSYRLWALWDSLTMPHPNHPTKRILDSMGWSKALFDAIHLTDRGLLGNGNSPGFKTSTLTLEHVSAAPGAGVASMFSFGKGVGLIEGVTLAHLCPLRTVRPAIWKEHFRLLNQTKDASREKAMELFPAVKDLFKRKCDDGRAEAVLLAMYGGEFSFL